MIQFKLYRRFIILSVLICCSLVADDFVPFVIPGKPNPDSLIAAAPGEPIRPASERLTVRNSHFFQGNEQVRLWGVNLSFGANFPRKEDAPFIAARMAAAGVNTVRCHHMDTARWPRGLWNAQDGKTIEPEALGRLDYFIDQLAKRGIYVNINLHVGREHSKYLGLPEANRKYDKISNIFTPALIDAQKQFARELLTRVNPYRKVRYADDPAVAIVEITNENSFFMWSNEETLRNLPPYYADILQKQFNTWLQKKYGSNKKLRTAWAEGAEPLGRNLLANGTFRKTSQRANIPGQWNLEQHAGCKASTSLRRYRSKDALQIKISKSDDTGWHLQLTQGGFPVEEGKYYTVMFDGAAERSRDISCSVSQAHSPWSNLGLSRQAELTMKWQSFRFGFVARTDDDNARVSFAFGGSDVPIYLANVELRPGGRLGLGKDESIEVASVKLYADNESPMRITDRMCFLAETEKQFFDGMRNFIKNDLGCKALVTGTIVFGPLGLYAQSDMDFIDAHAYWQHPRFPGRPWDQGNWLINQKPMTDYPAEATLFRLGAERLAGKPFTVSEYNHPAPLDSQAECVPMMASFAAAQDWDGVWFYTYSHGTDDWYREKMSGFFDIDTNPAKWGFMRAGAAIFRYEGLDHLKSSQQVSLCGCPESLVTLARVHLKYDRDMFGALSANGGIRREDLFKARLIPAMFGRPGGGDSITSEEKLKWSVEDGKGLYVAQGDAGILVGHASRFGEVTDDIHIDNPSYAVMTITPVDGKSISSSKKILITACGRCQNTGMKFSRNRQTVGRNWGEAPVLIEAVTGTVTLPEGQWKCQALGPDGTPKHDVPADNGVLKLSPEYETMWYLLTR